MKQMMMEMSYVADCSVQECAYNVNSNCHAKAITVGDGMHPGCDTFFASAAHTREDARTAGIGACKVTGCRHNDDYECCADHIAVGSTGGDVHCMTFMQR